MNATGSRVAQLVAVEDLPEYPIARVTRLDGHSFVKWAHLRWMSSTSFRRMAWEAQGMARALFDLAQMESPIGTLPDDDEELAYMLRVDIRRMRELRKAEFGPLRNWVPCLSEGERRLMHQVVLEQVRDALERREVHELSKEEKAAYQRVKRLREALEKLGLGADVLADDILIGRMDEWLKTQCRGNRKAGHYEAALIHAVQAGWVAEGARRRG
jgi:hypothetical protein